MSGKKLIIFIIVLLSIFSCCRKFHRQFFWEGPIEVDYGNSVVLDDSGNVYVMGRAFGKIGENEFKKDDNIFLTKLDPEGGILSTSQWSAGVSAVGVNLLLDSEKNIYIGGNSPQTRDEEIQGSDRKSKIFLQKLDSSGKGIWLKEWGSEKDDYFSSSALDVAGNIYVTGNTLGTIYNENNGKSDIFITKFDKNGEVKWGKQWGTKSGDHSEKVSVDKFGNVFVMGHTWGDLDGNSNKGKFDIFIIKLNSEGNKVWTRQLGTEENDIGKDMVIDSSGNFYISGYADGSWGTKSKGMRDVMLIKLSLDGELLWIRQWGERFCDDGFSLALDSKEDIYVTGGKCCSLQGCYKNFISKWTKDGNKIWLEQFGTKDRDKIESLAVDSHDNIYLTGFTEGILEESSCYTGKKSFKYPCSGVFLMKWKSDGTKLWTKQWGSQKIEK